MHGTAEEPYLWLHAAGHFDPVGFGDAEYGFTLYLSTHGTVHLGNIDTQTDGISIYESGNQIEVRLDQYPGLVRGRDDSAGFQPEDGTTRHRSGPRTRRLGGGGAH